MITKVIPATIPSRCDSPSPDKKVRVCAYARVSTDHEEQESSYEFQCAHYEKLIKSNPNWEFAGIYADEGISGLSTKNREQFLQMMADCENGKIDIILTKSVSRFARNTLDSLTHIRRLRELNVTVIFEKEGINTLDSSGELLLTIMASIAQQESESISRNVQLGVRYHFQEGKVCGGHQNMLGYRRGSNGKLEIIPEEAEIVRMIFRLFLNGCSPRHISELLRTGSYRDRNGRERAWDQTTVRYILSNPKYTGDLILQRYYTADVLKKKRRENIGQVPKYYVENCHEPVVPKAIFDRVQMEFARRSEQKARYSHADGLAGRIICGICGCTYMRRQEKQGKRVYYRCATKMFPKSSERYKKKYMGIVCNNGGITEEELQAAVLMAVNRLPERHEEFMRIRGQLAPETEGNAETSATEMHIRNILERIEAMRDLRPTGSSAGDRSPGCCDPEDFFARTRRAYPPGPVTAIAADEAVMWIERVVVAGGKVRVEFYGGVCAEYDGSIYC